MMPVRLCYAGAVVEPKAAGLLLATYHALERDGLDDLFEIIQAHVFVFGRTVLRAQTENGLQIWRLTDWAELALREVLARAARDVPAPLKREAILSAIALAGYGRTEQTT